MISKFEIAIVVTRTSIAGLKTGGRETVSASNTWLFHFLVSARPDRDSAWGSTCVSPRCKKNLHMLMHDAGNDVRLGLSSSCGTYLYTCTVQTHAEIHLPAKLRRRRILLPRRWLHGSVRGRSGTLRWQPRRRGMDIGQQG